MVRTRLTLQTIDLHCGGEPLRLITTGYPPVPMGTVLERRRWVAAASGPVRRTVVLEPRGHRDMYAAVLLPPGRPDADLTVLFMHNEGYSTMCGHGTIALATALVEEGLFPATEPETVIRFEAPAGVVTATRPYAAARAGRPKSPASASTTCPRTWPPGIDRPARWTGPAHSGPAQGRYRLRRRLLRHRRRGRPGPAGRPGPDRGADAGRGGHHRRPPPRPHAAAPDRRRPGLRVRHDHRRPRSCLRPGRARP